MIDQGLTINDEKFTRKFLGQCSYYRFKAYLIPFLDEHKQFHSNACFNDAYQLYQFDSHLRSYLFKYIEHIEVGVRSSLDRWLTEQTGNAFWYLDASLFQRNNTHINTINNIRSQFIGSKEPFAEHFQTSYHNEYCPFYRDLPPAWVALELMTFGNLTNLLKSFTQESIQALKLDRYTKSNLKIKSIKTLVSWMTTLQTVRNHCGHHTRLFNRNIQAPTAIKRILNPNIKLVSSEPQPNGRQLDQLNRLYTALAALQYSHDTLGYNDKIGPELSKLFETYPTVNKFKASMGFPIKWQEETLFFK